MLADCSVVSLLKMIVVDRKIDNDFWILVRYIFIFVSGRDVLGYTSALTKYAQISDK